MRIYVDMDGVLVDFYGGMERYINDKYQFPVDKNKIEDYSITRWIRNFGYSQEQAKQMKYEIFQSLDFWESLDVKGGEETVDIFEWMYKNHEVYIATSVFLSQSEACYIGKPRWIKKNLPFFHISNLIYSHVKYYLRGDMLVEDHAGQIMKFQGIQALIDGPYNRYYEPQGNVTERGYPFYRVKSFRQIRDIINNS